MIKFTESILTQCCYYVLARRTCYNKSTHTVLIYWFWRLRSSWNIESKTTFWLIILPLNMGATDASSETDVESQTHDKIGFSKESDCNLNWSWSSFPLYCFIISNYLHGLISYNCVLQPFFIMRPMLRCTVLLQINNFHITHYFTMF